MLIIVHSNVENFFRRAQLRLLWPLKLREKVCFMSFTLFLNMVLF